MMTDGSPEDPRPSAEEDDAALWRLLERAKRPGPVSPYFARRVLREVAASEKASPGAEAERPGWLARLWRPWQGQARGVLAGAMAAVALLAVGVKVSPTHWNTPTVAPSVTTTTAPARSADVEPTAPEGAPEGVAAVAEPAVAAQDVEVIADLDNLLSNEESRLWSDEETTARY